jgi:hypothetical protein
MQLRVEIDDGVRILQVAITEKEQIRIASWTTPDGVWRRLDGWTS